jgi:hypothetical protein
VIISLRESDNPPFGGVIICLRQSKGKFPRFARKLSNDLFTFSEAEIITLAKRDHHFAEGKLSLSRSEIITTPWAPYSACGLHIKFTKGI